MLGTLDFENLNQSPQKQQENSNRIQITKLNSVPTAIIKDKPNQ